MSLLTKRTTARPSGYDNRFAAHFIGFLIASIVLWTFYRWLFNNDSSILSIGVISIATSWFWAYIFGYGGDQHTGE